jgi:ketosteroid isomerase-like protein
LEVEDARTSGDQVVVVVRAMGPAEGGGPRLDQRVGYVMSFRDGRIVHSRPYQKCGTRWRRTTIPYSWMVDRVGPTGAPR